MEKKMDPSWISIAAGVITVITGIITIVNAFKPKTKLDNGATLTEAKRKNFIRPATVVDPKAIGNPPKAVSGVQEFSGNDKEYQEWVTRHPQGFVVNTAQGISPEYMALHKASCGHVSNFNSHKPGAFTERDYMKACSTDLDRLREWAKAHGRTDGSFTGKCQCNAT
jgi:hypothetical protein